MWLLKRETAVEMQRLARTLRAPTHEQRVAFKAERDEREKVRASADNPVAQVAGTTMEVAVSGVLLNADNFLYWLFGIPYTVYSDIRQALAQAATDPAITNVILRVDSPGGQVDGLFETLAALQAFTKPISTIAAEACSAAYAIAASTHSIVATNPAATFGSVGVVASVLVEEDVVDITSTEAPNKRPDVTTDEGQAVVREYLDAVHGLFVEAIASGRGTTVENVNANYGRGQVMVAGDAQKRGMINGVQGSLRAVKPQQAAASAEQSGAEKDDTMDLKKLKAEHSDIYEAAVQDGTKAERDRVSAHLKLGAMGGDKGMKIALAAIASGAAITMELQADYIVAASDMKQVASRQEESDAAAQTTARAAGVVTAEQQPAKDLGDQVADRIEAQLGVKKVA